MPNQYGGRENLEAIAFLQQLNERGARRRSPARSTIAEESTAWPGVSRPTYARRARLRLQVEHGLDARHARVLRARPGLPQAPPRRADVQPDLRVHRELRAAALARRGRARQGLAARQDAGRPLAEVRQPARALRLHVGAPRQEAAVHGRRVRARSASGTTTAASTGTCSSAASIAACSRSCGDLNRALPRRAGAVRARLRARRLRVARARTTQPPT